MLIQPTVVKGGILEVESELSSNGLVFTGSAQEEITQLPTIRIPKGLLSERSDGKSNVCVHVCIHALQCIIPQ